MTGIVLTAFGVPAVNGAASLLAVEDSVRREFPSFGLRWAFTAKRPAKGPAFRGEAGLYVAEALSHFAREKRTRVVVQPLHLTDGYEQELLRRQIAACQNDYSTMRILLGEPLLSGEDSFQTLLDAMRRTETAVCDPTETALWVGHGNEPPLDGVCRRLALRGEAMRPPVRVAYLIGEKTVEEHCGELLQCGATQLCLMPLFALAGRHVTHDLDGDAVTSWKTRCVHAGMPCRVHTRGMAEDALFRNMWMERLRDALSATEA